MSLEQPRAYMSRNLARGWWEQYVHQVVAHDHVIINGKPQKPPRAYDRWLRERSEVMQDIIRWQRVEQAKSASKEQTRARARNAHARAKSKSKKI